MNGGLPGRRIGIDARMLGDGGTGVSTYARSLLSAMPLIDGTPVVIGARPGGRARRIASAVLPVARPLRASGDGGLTGHDIFRMAQVHFDIHRRALALRAPGPPGIMHWSYPVPLRLIGWRNLYTVHDAIPFTHPELTPINPRRHARLLEAILPRAAALVTVSAQAREDILATVAVGDLPVIDCGQPVILPAHAPPPHPDWPSGSYFLFCGSIEPRKNIARLIAAHRASGTALPLLLVGPDGWHGANELAGAMPGGGVVRLPYQDRAALLGLIAHARALLFPSLAEGFGLPIAEAMTLGAAVMTSAGGATAETAGGAALTVDPLDMAAMAAAIARLATDDALVADLVARGRARAGAFGLARFAGRLATVYDGMFASLPGHPYQPRP